MPNQHAEAAAKIYKLAEDATDALMLEAGDGVEFWSTAPRILAKHMQAAIDEATAPLKARVATLEMLGPQIERLLGNPTYAEELGIRTHIAKVLRGGSAEPAPDSLTPTPGSSKTLP